MYVPLAVLIGDRSRVTHKSHFLHKVSISLRIFRSRSKKFITILCIIIIFCWFVSPITGVCAKATVPEVSHTEGDANRAKKFHNGAELKIHSITFDKLIAGEFYGIIKDQDDKRHVVRVPHAHLGIHQSFRRLCCTHVGIP